jgi:hypothetical protein
MFRASHRVKLLALLAPLSFTGLGPAQKQAATTQVGGDWPISPMRPRSFPKRGWSILSECTAHATTRPSHTKLSTG